jgi:hypothetical protein
MLEPTAPANNDSTAPSAVMVRMGAMNSGRFVHGMLAKAEAVLQHQGLGMAPMVGADQANSPVEKRGEDEAEQRGGETRCPFLRHEQHRRNDNESENQRLETGGESALKISKEFLSGGLNGGSLDAQEVVDLTDEDDERDARGEAADDGRGDEGDEATEPQETDEEQERA